jgi:hypothetical protein
MITEYKIKKGDILTSIGRNNGVHYKFLAAMNP